jgi:tripartite ATP-independent transporter DctP family solute receptor
LLFPAALCAKVTLRAAQVLAETHPTNIALERLRANALEKSGGELEIVVTDSKSFGGERELIEAMQMGDLELIVIATAALYGFASDFLVFDLPYAFPDQATARRVLDSPFGQERLDDASQAGLKGLAYYENGLRHVSASNKEIRAPSDLAGLRIRTMESRIHVDAFRELGASPVPLSYGELYGNLKSGRLDAEENPIPVFVTGKLYEVQRFYTMTGHFYMPAPVFVSLSAWGRLSPELQNILTEAAKESALYQRALCDGFETEAAMGDLAKKVSLLRFVDREPWKAAFAPVRKRYGAEVGEQTLSQLDRAIEEARIQMAKAAEGAGGQMGKAAEEARSQMD